MLFFLQNDIDIYSFERIYKYRGKYLIMSAYHINKEDL